MLHSAYQQGIISQIKESLDLSRSLCLMSIVLYHK